jgi:hypothetical protein
MPGSVYPVVAGMWSAVDELIELLLSRGRVDDAVEVLRRSGDNDRGTDRRLLDLLVRYRRIDDLRTLADGGDWAAAHGLFELLVRRGEDERALDGFRRRVRAGHDHAVGRLTQELVARDRMGEAIAVYRERVEAGDDEAARSFAVFLGQHERVGELRELAGRGDARATYALVHLLDEQGLVEEAANALRPLADEGDDTAGFMLVRLWSRHGRLEPAATDRRRGSPCTVPSRAVGGESAPGIPVLRSPSAGRHVEFDRRESIKTPIEDCATSEEAPAMDLPRHPLPGEFPNTWNGLPAPPAAGLDVEVTIHPENAVKPPDSSLDTTLIPPPEDRGSSSSGGKPGAGFADRPDITAPPDRRPAVEAVDELGSAGEEVDPAADGGSEIVADNNIPDLDDDPRGWLLLDAARRISEDKPQERRLLRDRFAKFDTLSEAGKQEAAQEILTVAADIVARAITEQSHRTEFLEALANWDVDLNRAAPSPDELSEWHRDITQVLKTLAKFGRDLTPEVIAKIGEEMLIEMLFPGVHLIIPPTDLVGAVFTAMALLKLARGEH